MGKAAQDPTPSTDQPSSADRMESWKEIAAYLKRDVRTVQRWEKNEGLPVHRHVHHSLGTVYAYKPDLDAWWNNRRPRLEREEVALPSSRRRLWWALAATSVIVIAASLGMWRARRTPPLAFRERDWVLIANFENRTGEAVFDGTLEYALERELSNSTFVNVVPRERINDALRLMKRPLNPRLDAATAREVCLRDGGIRALLTGRVEKLGSTYALSVQLVDPQQGLTVASLSEDDRDPEHLLPAVRKLSNGVREALGEKLALIRTSDQRFEKVTTPSLRALELYSQGVALFNPTHRAEAADLFEQAIREDPQFASAHIYLAQCYFSLDKPKEAAPHFERALELADTTSDRERYLIVGSYWQLYKRNLEKAAEAFGVLVRLYPDDYTGISRLIATDLWLARPEEVVQLYIRRADIRPNDFEANRGAVAALRGWGADCCARARPYAAKARQLMTPEVIDRDPGAAADLELLPAWESWQRGDFDDVHRELLRAQVLALERTGEARTALLVPTAYFYLSLGKLQEAAEVFQAESDPAERGFGLALVALQREDRRGLYSSMSHFSPPKATVQPAVSEILMARAGLLSQAQQGIHEHPSKQWQWLYERGMPGGFIAVIQGELVLARGEPARAIPLLGRGTDRISTGWHRTAFFLGSESLARAWEQQGKLPRAIQVLEQAVQNKRRLWVWDVFAWMRDEAYLARLYRQAGREEDARAIEAELRKLLAIADPDHPILVKLQASSLRTPAPGPSSAALRK